MRGSAIAVFGRCSYKIRRTPAGGTFSKPKAPLQDSMVCDAPHSHPPILFAIASGRGSHVLLLFGIHAICVPIKIFYHPAHPIHLIYLG